MLNGPAVFQEVRTPRARGPEYTEIPGRLHITRSAHCQSSISTPSCIWAEAGYPAQSGFSNDRIPEGLGITRGNAMEWSSGTSAPTHFCTPGCLAPAEPTVRTDVHVSGISFDTQTGSRLSAFSKAR